MSKQNLQEGEKVFTKLMVLVKRETLLKFALFFT
jgi:hypothetical protein